MNTVDGMEIRAPHQERCDVVVVGSGPAGATVARDLARAGVQVVVVEEGPLVRPAELPVDGFTAMARLYRDMGTSIMMGKAPMPVLQGRLVGGTSVVNGAISWRLPKDVHEQWIRDDPALGDALEWSSLEESFDTIEAELSIAPTDASIAGANNTLLAKGAEALGLEHRPIRRNARDCRGLGRCLQGCPQGRKTSMDVSYLPEACAQGARIISSTEITGVSLDGSRATGVVGRAAGGGAVSITAKGGVVLAASAIQTPVLLIKSGIRQGPVGDNLQCHPGVSVAGRFDEPVRLWTGATQGHEVIGLRSEGLKFEALGYDLGVAAMRLKGVGSAFRAQLETLPHWCQWGAAIRAAGRGRVRPGRRGARIRFDLAEQDLRLARRGVQILGEMLLAAGAEVVVPGVHGWQERVEDRATMARFGQQAPLSPKSYTMAATHLFGTCRMGSDPATSVVRPDFRHHAVSDLYVADSSVFPSNTGVNPQTSIIALARKCAERIIDSPLPC